MTNRTPLALSMVPVLVVLASGRAHAQPETPPAEPPAVETPAIAVVADDAALDAFVAQRRAIEEQEANGQRGVFALPALGTLLEGATSFLLERAQAEVETYGAEVLNDTLCTRPEIHRLVPTACQVLASWAEGGGAERAGLDTLVAALRADLESIAPRLVGIALSAASGVAERVRLGLASLAVVIDAVSAGVEPREIADRLFELALSCDVAQDGTTGIAECSSEDGKRAQRELLRRANLLAWAFGAPVDDVDGLAIVGPVPEERAADVRRALRRLLETLRDWQRTARWLQDPDPDADAERRREMGDALARITVDLVFGADDAVRARDGSTASRRARDDARMAVAALVTSAVAADPSASIAEALALLRAGAAWVAAEAGEAAHVEVPSGVLQALAAASALATARDAEAVEAVFENLAAPVASWRSKRDGTVISLTGLIGLTASYDLLAEGGDFSTLGDLTTAGLGVQLAVGIDFNLLGGSAGTFGLFVQVVDLGALVSFPFGGDTDQVQFQIDPLSLLSPGLYVRFGILETPFVIAAGGMFVPHARSVERLDMMGNPIDVPLDAVRLSLTLSVDTTLWVF